MNGSGGTRVEWHVDDAQIVVYAQEGERSFAVASIEAHLLECEQCRASLAAVRRADPQVANRQRAAWDGVADRIDQPRRPFLDFAPALQVSLGSLPLLGSTLGAALALVATLGAVGFAVPQSSVWVQLALAPLVPMLAATVAFHPGTDPAGQLAASTALAGGRVPYMRALVATLLSLIAGLVASMFISLPIDTTLVWLLPGLAFATTVISIGTWVDPTRVAAALSLGWAVLVGGWWSRWRGVPTQRAVGQLLVSQRGTQLACLIIAMAAVAISYKRRDALPNWRTQ